MKFVSSCPWFSRCFKLGLLGNGRLFHNNTSAVHTTPPLYVYLWLCCCSLWVLFYYINFIRSVEQWIFSCVFLLCLFLTFKFFLSPYDEILKLLARESLGWKSWVKSTIPATHIIASLHKTPNPSLFISLSISDIKFWEFIFFWGFCFLQITGETVGELKAVADMHQRKAEMARHSDAFIALPG